MIKFEQIDKYLNDIKYEICNPNRIYSDRSRVSTKVRELIEPCYVHLWMVMYPLKGQEYTITKNITDLAGWLFQITSKLDRYKINILSIYENLESNFLRKVKSNLVDHHGYSNLISKSGIEISEKFSEIITRISYDLILNRKKNKHYEISKDRIIEIIKETLNISD